VWVRVNFQEQLEIFLKIKYSPDVILEPSNISFQTAFLVGEYALLIIEQYLLHTEHMSNHEGLILHKHSSRELSIRIVVHHPLSLV